MQIYWFKESYIKIIGNNVSLAIAPCQDAEAKLPKYEPGIVLSEIGMVSSLRGKPFLVDKPGEYETSGVFIYGIHQQCAPKKHHLLYRVEIENISIGHLGYLSCDLDAENYEKLEGVDILFVPCGGDSVVDAKKAVEVVKNIEPRMVIPIHYSVSKSKDKLSTVDPFIKEMGLANIQQEDKLKIKHKDLPQEETVMVVLKSAV